MKSINKLIAGIEYKVRELTERLQSLQVEKKELNQAIDNLKQTIEEQNSKIRELEEKLFTLKLVKTLNKGKENLAEKYKINELVREIDKCIGLLNK
ncbi:MAG: hypothetical protein M0R21_07325 [Lentimicrobiaceae bacterium]|nr:hypothetical protein [Lentimicrobiaceae bacterium]